MSPPPATTTTATVTITREPSTQGAGAALLLVRLARVSKNRLQAAFDALEMRTQDFAVLHYLEEAGPLSQQELGSALRVDPSNLVAHLDALEDAGFLVRRRDPADRRRHLVGLTKAGQRRLRSAEHAALAAENEMLEPLSPAERRQLQTLLARMASHACGGKGICG